MTAVTSIVVWERLRSAGLVEGETPVVARVSTPWFVRAALGIAGWIGAICLFGFVAAGLEFVVQSAAASAIVGALACAGAAVILRVGSENDFAGQFGLAVSLAGQALLVRATYDWIGHDLGTQAVVAMIQQAVLFAVVPNAVHRVWTGWTGAFAGVLALQRMSLGVLAPPMLLAALFAASLVELDRPRAAATLRAASYGIALAILTVVTVDLGKWMIVSEFRLEAEEMPAAIERVLLTAVLFAGTACLLRREGVELGSHAGLTALAGAVVLGAISLKAPGVGLTVAILVLGYANGNRVLAGLGITALVVYLGTFYYTLEATLLQKSALLAGGGLVLLGVRALLLRSWPTVAEDGHA